MLPFIAHQNNTVAATQPVMASPLLLRNLMAVVPAGAPEAGLRIAGPLYDGVSGAEIIAATTGGDVGPGIFGDTVLDPLKGYRLLVTSSTGTFSIFENGSGTFSTDWTATFNVYEDNLLIGTTTQGGVMVVPPVVGVLPGMVAARTMPAIAMTYTAPGAALVLPGMAAARTLQAFALAYTGPLSSMVLPGMQASRTLAPVSISYSAGAALMGLPGMLAGSMLQPVTLAYTAPQYGLALAGMAAPRTLAPVVLAFAPGSALLGLPGLQMQSALQPVAVVYQPPTYQGLLPGLQCLVTMPAVVLEYLAPNLLPQATPGYASQDDMRVRFGLPEIVQLTDRAPTAQEVDTEVMSRALLDADAEINMRLHSRYKLPLENVPRVLVNIACDIARWRLMEDRATDQVTRRYEEALKLLDKIGRGDLALGLEAGESRLRANGGAAVVGGGKRIFSRGRLADYAGEA